MSAHPFASIVFCGCAAAIGWVYFGYPLVLGVGLLGGRKRFIRAGTTPLVSIIIPAHNEEAGIEAKLQNLLALDYPREEVEILVGSDGSSDRTQEIVERFAREGVGLISLPQHQGKSAIQNGLVAVASGEILVFTDADCILPAHALRCLIENFADPRVGLVTAHPKYIKIIYFMQVAVSAYDAVEAALVSPANSTTASRVEAYDDLCGHAERRRSGCCRRYPRKFRKRESLCQ